MLDSLTELYSSDVRSRVSAAAGYTVFPERSEPPAAFRTSWLKALGGQDAKSGDRWPGDLAAACASGTWPRHAFGTANAPLLVLWHRPGVAAPGSQIEPETPTLGGVGHAHVERFVPDYLARDKSWDLLHGRLDQICATTRPLLVLACGNPVRDALRAQGWRPPTGATLIGVDHPAAWDGYGSGRREGQDVVLPLLKMWAEGGALVRPTSAAPAGVRRYVDPARRRPA